MFWVVRQLCAPLRYLKIKQGYGLFKSKTTYDFVLPGMIAILSGIAVWYFSLDLGFFTQQGFVPDVMNLLNLLIAFFIAALAALATFDRPGLDEPMKGDPATLKRLNRHNEISEITLSHRQFVCYLFGFLSFISLILLMSLYTIRMLKIEIIDILLLSSWVAEWGKPIAAAAFFFILSQLTIAMLLGVYFLSDRLQFLDNKSI